MTELTNNELLKVFYSDPTYDLETCEEICKRSGMFEEFENAEDATEVEDIIEKAVECLERIGD